MIKNFQAELQAAGTDRGKALSGGVNGEICVAKVITFFTAFVKLDI